MRRGEIAVLVLLAGERATEDSVSRKNPDSFPVDAGMTGHRVTANGNSDARTVGVPRADKVACLLSP